MFEGVKGATRNLKPAPTQRAGQFLGHFGATLGSLWVYSGDFVLLSDCFGIIVASLWVYLGRLKKSFIFPIDLNDFMENWVALGSLWGRFGATFGI